MATSVSCRVSPESPIFQVLALGPVVKMKVLDTESVILISLQKASTVPNSLFIPLKLVLEMSIRSSAKKIPVRITDPSWIPIVLELKSQS